MANVSRPLIGLLVATVLVFVLWTVALKPSSSSSGGSGSGSGGVGAYQGAINAAHGAVARSNADNAAQGGVVANGSASKRPAPTTTTATTSATSSKAKPATSRATHAATTTQQRVDIVTRALKAHKVLALLFFNPSGSDDQAVEQELAAVPTYRGRVVKLAVPVDELTRYPAVTTQVPVTSSPTLVLVDPAQQASTIVGFADRFEISQRVADALTVK